ncbi:winged helix-turn-helix domain-containing protein [Fodinicola feengrottensis]|uniref:winged helix-turn-helix domain-containing protein n=1 Tax=Fodinicola feengrottensis TaxID=435914 RepID=UPI0013D2D161|nr:GntR family transcriptional regulator [Fodinicola feengrottensis]
MATNSENTTKYARLASVLRERIEDGVYPPGSPLPSENQLTAEYGESRATARNAVQALAAEGLVTVLHGKGAFVRPPPPHRPPQPDAHPGPGRHHQARRRRRPRWRL